MNTKEAFKVLAVSLIDVLLISLMIYLFLSFIFSLAS